MRKFFGAIIGVPMAFMSTAAFAALDVSTISLAEGTGNVEILTATILGGLALMWGVRKLIKMTNRS